MDDSDLPHVPGASNLAASYMEWNKPPGSDGGSVCGDEQQVAHGDTVNGGAQGVGMEPLPGACCSGPLPLYLMEGASGQQGSSDAAAGRCASAPNAACSLIRGLPQGFIAGEISESGSGRANGSVRGGAVLRPQRVGGRRDGDASSVMGLLPELGLHRSGGGAGRAPAGQVGAPDGVMRGLQGPCDAAVPPGLAQQKLLLHPLAAEQSTAAVSASPLLPQAVAVDAQRASGAAAGPASSEPRSVISLAVWRATPEGGITQVAATRPAAAMGPQPGAAAAAVKAHDAHAQEAEAVQRPLGLVGGNAEQGVPLETLWLAANAQPAEGSSHGFLVMELCEGGSLFAWRSVQWRSVGEVPDMVGGREAGWHGQGCCCAWQRVPQLGAPNEHGWGPILSFCWVLATPPRRKELRRMFLDSSDVSKVTCALVPPRRLCWFAWRWALPGAWPTSTARCGGCRGHRHLHAKMINRDGTRCLSYGT